MARHSTLIRSLAIAMLLLMGAGLALAQQMGDEEAAVLGVMALVWGGICCVSLAVAIGVAWWIHKDATARGVAPMGWAIFGFFLPVIALIVWLVTRPKD